MKLCIYMYFVLLSLNCMLLLLYLLKQRRYSIIYEAVLCVCFVDLRPKSTAIVMAGQLVHLATLFPGQA